MEKSADQLHGTWNMIAPWLPRRLQIGATSITIEETSHADGNPVQQLAGLQVVPARRFDNFLGAGFIERSILDRLTKLVPMQDHGIRNRVIVYVLSENGETFFVGCSHREVRLKFHAQTARRAPARGDQPDKNQRIVRILAAALERATIAELR